MDAPKFTPGPWHVHPFRAQVDTFVWTDAETLDPVPVCALLWLTDRRSEGETEANAHLIAAAPELYAALEKLYNRLLDKLEWPEEYESELASARSALAKARGE